MTDKLRSYGAALKELLPRTEHRQSRYLNNRAECSHQRTRATRTSAALQAGRGPLQRFNSPGHAGRFLSIFEPLNTHFRPPRHLLKAYDYRQKLQECFSTAA